jgi:predicted acylesterase/phospholipase RssA
MPQDAFYTQLPARQTLVDGIFKGGGTGGIVYVGSVMALARHGVWFKRTAGASAGSIIAAMIAAGYDANECDYLAAPSGARRPAPDTLPPGAEPLEYGSLLDLPSSPEDVTLESRRNNLIYRAIAGAAIDELLKIPVALPSVEPLVNRVADQVLAELPSSIGPAKVKVGPFKVKVGPLAVDTDRYEVEVGPFPLPDVKPLIHSAVARVLQAYPRSLSLGKGGLLSGEKEREGLADAVINALMTVYPFLIVYLHFLGDGGLFKGDAFLQSMQGVLEAKVGRHPVRFIDLPMEFACAACDVTSHSLEVYSPKTTPEMEVAEAVRRSMSIPFFFKPRQENQHEIMDGSLIDNSLVGLYLARDNGYFENTAEDMQRAKMGFRPRAAGPGRGLAVDAEKILEQHIPAGRQIPDTVEVACLKRAVNIAVASMQESPLLAAMLRELKDAANYYEISGELEDHNPVDFDITPAKFNRLCSKGWQGAMPQLKQGVDDGNLTLAVALNDENPYR